MVDIFLYFFFIYMYNHIRYFILYFLLSSHLGIIFMCVESFKWINWLENPVVWRKTTKYVELNTLI